MFAPIHFLLRTILRPWRSRAALCALTMLVVTSAAMARCNNQDEVYLFERPGCASCMAVKRPLAHHGVYYESRDARSPENASCMQTYAGTLGTPVVRIGNRTHGYRHVVGHNVLLLKSYLCLY